MSRHLVISKNIQVRESTDEDIAFIIATENKEEYQAFINRWTRDEHYQTISSSNKKHLIIENTKGIAIGYIILSGLDRPETIEFTRITLNVTGKGYGTETITILCNYIFVRYNSQSIWLDVKEHNERARHVYKKIGFKEVARNEVENLIIMELLRNDFYRE